MMKRTLLFSVFLALLLSNFGFQTRWQTAFAPNVSHKAWDLLLKKHVRENGLVDYKGFVRDSTQLNQYLKTLEVAQPNASNWSQNDKKAFWINAYNAFTIQLVLRNYPVSSIKDIKRGIPLVNTVWDIQFIHIGGKTYDLNNIEHSILRPQFKDARVHAAINCASFSCPKLSRDAYDAAQVDAQLDAAMRSFVNDPDRNLIQQNRVQLSEIFKWFSGDFERDAGSVRQFVNRYAKQKIASKTKIEYLDYNWNLNTVE